MSGFECREIPSGVLFGVRLKPRARRERLEPAKDGLLQAAVHAPPVGGEANRSLVRLLARALGVPPSAISIVRGETGRVKSLLAAGLSAERLRRRLHELGLE